LTVVSVLRLTPREGGGPRLERAFSELEIFEHSRRSGGFLRGRLLRPLTAGEPYAVVAEWEDADSYQRWLDNPVREEMRGELEPLLSSDVASGELFEEVS
jgi:heme-degrading monooxygenase HmoA